MARGLPRPAINTNWDYFLSGRLDNGTRTNTASTHAGFFHPAGVGNHTNPLQVGEPASSCLVMSMGNIVPGNGSLSTYLTYLGHFSSPDIL